MKVIWLPDITDLLDRGIALREKALNIIKESKMTDADKEFARNVYSSGFNAAWGMIKTFLDGIITEEEK